MILLIKKQLKHQLILTDAQTNSTGHFLAERERLIER